MPEELDERFGVPISSAPGIDLEQVSARYNIAPTEQVLAVVAPKGEPEARMLRWGLVPPWAKDLKGSAKTINARLETVARTPAYRALIPRGARRALQVADGWYEWLKPEKRDQPRQPVFFAVDDDIPFAFAAVWTPAKVGGEWVQSVALLTCDASANRLAAAVHGRMPVVLADPEAQRLWLDPSLGAEEALALCGPLPESRLSARPANPAVNKVVVSEGPELLSAPPLQEGTEGASALGQAPQQAHGAGEDMTLFT